MLLIDLLSVSTDLLMKQRTTLKYQLIELLAQIHASLTLLLDDPTDAAEPSELTRLHYDVLDGCAGVLIMLHTSERISTEQPQSPAIVPGSLSTDDLFRIMSELMDSRHPTTFRQAFVRLAIMVRVVARK